MGDGLFKGGECLVRVVALGEAREVDKGVHGGSAESFSFAFGPFMGGLFDGFVGVQVGDAVVGFVRCAKSPGSGTDHYRSITTPAATGAGNRA